MGVPAQVQAYLDGPSSPTPPGWTSNLENPPNSNAMAYTIFGICTFLIVAALSGRVYSRLFIVKQFHPEDYFGLFCILPYAGYAYNYISWGLNVGFMVHQWDLRGAIIVYIGKHTAIVGITYSLVLMFLKVAILLEWVRIFVPRGQRNALYWTSMAVLLVNVLLYSSLVLVVLGTCRPFEKNWQFWLPGYCVNKQARDFVAASLNLVTDVFILILPQRVIWKLQMTRRRRIGVSVVFSVGLLVIALAAGRLYYTVTLDYPTVLTKPFDTTYKFSYTLIWAMCEQACLFLVFCVPALPKLFMEDGVTTRILRSWRSWTRLAPSLSTKPSNKTLRPNDDIVPDLPHNVAYLHKDSMSGTESLEMRALGKSPMARSDGPVSDSQILKTVEFNSREEAVSNTASSDYFVERQHPWMNHSV